MKEFFTTSEAARLLGVKSSSSIQKKIAAGEIPAFRAAGGRDYRITRSNLIEYMKTHSIPVPQSLEEPEPRILIVDDKPDMTAPLAEFLQESEYKVEIASSGLEAGYKLKDFKPHVILLDMLLGDMDGRDFLKIISNDQQMKNAKVIGMSAFLKRQDLSPEDLSKMHAFLTKPFHYDRLLKKIERAIEKLGQKSLSI